MSLPEHQSSDAKLCVETHLRYHVYLSIIDARVRAERNAPQFASSRLRLQPVMMDLLTTGVEKRKARPRKTKKQIIQNFTCKHPAESSQLVTYTETFNKHEERYELRESSVKTITIT